jgi:hypothetical protein
MSGKIAACFIASLSLLLGLLVGFLLPRPIPSEIMAYYVRNPSGGFDYIQQDPTGPMLPGIVEPELTRFWRAANKADPDIRRAAEKAAPDTLVKGATEKAAPETSEKAERIHDESPASPGPSENDASGRLQVPEARGKVPGNSTEILEKAVKAIESNDVLVAELLCKKHSALRATVREDEKKYLLQFYVKTDAGRTFLVNVRFEALLDRLLPHGDLKEIPAIASLCFIEEITIPVRDQKKIQEQNKLPK